MIKVKTKKQNAKYRAKTEPNQPIDPDIRVSLAHPATKELIEISSINNYLQESRGRDWTEDEHHQTIHFSSFDNKDFDADNKNSHSKQVNRKNFKLYSKLKDCDYLKKFNQTQSQIKQQNCELAAVTCNSINLQFEAVSKQKQLRIHSNGHVSIQFDNASFCMSEKSLRQNAVKKQNKKGLNIYIRKDDKHKNIALKTPVIPIKKQVHRVECLEAKNATMFHQKVKETSHFKNSLSLKKQFVDLSCYLKQEKRNIFCPTKINFLSKQRHFKH